MNSHQVVSTLWAIAGTFALIVLSLLALVHWSKRGSSQREAEHSNMDQDGGK